MGTTLLNTRLKYADTKHVFISKSPPATYEICSQCACVIYSIFLLTKLFSIHVISVSFILLQDIRWHISLASKVCIEALTL